MKSKKGSRFFQKKKILCGSLKPGGSLGIKKFFRLPKKSKNNERGVFLKLHTVQSVARLLNLTERRIRQLRDEGIIKEIRPGLYNLIETNHDYIGFLKGDSKTEEKISYHEERAKLVRAKRKNQELDLKIRQGELHEAAEIEEVMGEMLTNFKVRLMAIPAKLSPILSAKKNKTEIYRILSEAVEEALQELADFETAFHIEEIEEEGEAGGADEDQSKYD